MTPDELEARLYANERNLLGVATMASAAWKLELRQFDGVKRFEIPVVEMEAILKTLDEVLDIAWTYHIAAEDLVG